MCADAGYASKRPRLGKVRLDKPPQLLVSCWGGRKPPIFIPLYTHKENMIMPAMLSSEGRQRATRVKCDKETRKQNAKSNKSGHTLMDDWGAAIRAVRSNGVSLDDIVAEESANHNS